MYVPSTHVFDTYHRYDIAELASNNSLTHLTYLVHITRGGNTSTIESIYFISDVAEESMYKTEQSVLQKRRGFEFRRGRTK